jgi:hypothetical protein
MNEKTEYTYDEAVALGLGVRFQTMRRVPMNGELHALFMWPIRPGEPGYDAAAFEVVSDSEGEDERGIFWSAVL